MRFLYSLLIGLSTPVVLLYFVIRGTKDRAYLRRWPERFGFVRPASKTGGILLHAASVGEFNAARPLIKSLLKTYPELPLTVTTLTPTGSERVRRELADDVHHCYIPLDLPGAVSRFLGRVQPRLIIVMETEIWPNLFLTANRLDIPLMMANARLSERSVKRFQIMPDFVTTVLKPVTWIGAQSVGDAERLISCGANPQDTEITGNLKFELVVPASLEEKAAALRSRWNRSRPVLVAGSTHEADEIVLIPAFVELLKTLPDALLILVPRYPERFKRATQHAKAVGLQTQLRSQNEICSEQAQCFIIDSIGELMTYYACGDVTFVGGSMGEQGGHNPLEPAALGKPVLFGPKMENAREIADQLLACNAASCVSTQSEFHTVAENLLTDGGLRDSMGQAGRALVEKNSGALGLTLESIKKLITS